MIITPRVRTDLLKNQTAIVTGGSRGIGGATSTLLAANGAHVVIADVDATKAEQTVAELNQQYGDNTASSFIGDLVQTDTPDRLVTHTLDRFGSLDIVVNNAGYAWDGRVHAMTDDQFQAMLDIHLTVPFRLARASAPIFRDAAKADRDNGTPPRNRKTIMVSSMAAQWGLAGAANYAAAKSGMLGLMRTLAHEWGSYHVNVNAVAFGVIQTRFAQPQSESEVIETGGRTIHVGMTAKQAARAGVTVDRDHPPTDAEIYRPRPIPGVALGRSGTINEAAEAIFWLASPLSDYVTGQVIPVAGGATGGMS